MKILIMGLPGSGKTTLAEQLAERLNAIHFNADQVRQNLNKDLGFSLDDRIEQARRMGFLAETVSNAGHIAICDFVCPTTETRAAFNADYVIWMDTIKTGRFENTNKIFEEPAWNQYDFAIKSFPYTVDDVITDLGWKDFVNTKGKQPHALLIGRYQPFHDGHLALVIESLQRVGKVCIAIRDTGHIDQKNPFEFTEVKQMIKDKLRNAGITGDSVSIVQIPNITNIYYGRDVGYKIEHLELSPELQSISATDIREQMKGYDIPS